MIYCGFWRALAWFFAAALRERELDSSPGGLRPFWDQSRPAASSLQTREPGPSGPLGQGWFDLGRRALPSFFRALGPRPRRGGRGGAAPRPRRRPRPACRPPPAPSGPRCGARLRQPSPRSSHDGGCPRRRAPGARWGRRVRGGCGGRAGLTLMSPLVSPHSILSPARRAPPTSQEGLDDGPDFLSEEDRGVSSASFWLAGPSLPRLGPGVWYGRGVSLVARHPLPAGLLSISSPHRAPPSCSPSSLGAVRF